MITKERLTELRALCGAATPPMHKDEIAEHVRQCNLGNQCCHNCPALKCCDNQSAHKQMLAAVPELLEEIESMREMIEMGHCECEEIQAELRKEHAALRAELTRPGALTRNGRRCDECLEHAPQSDLRHRLTKRLTEITAEPAQSEITWSSRDVAAMLAKILGTT